MTWSRITSVATYTRVMCACATALVAMVLCVPWAQAGVTERVSVSGSGLQGALESGAPSVSADGRYVAFVSAAANLVSGDSNGDYDVFVYDRQIGLYQEGERVQFGRPGRRRQPLAGYQRGRPTRSLPFQSRRPGARRHQWQVGCLCPHGGHGGHAASGSGGDGAQPDADCTRVSIDGDGSVVVFTSAATNLVPGDTNGVADVFVRDLTAGTTGRVNVGAGGAQADRRSDFVSVSADGRYVAFDSIADNLVSSDSNGNWDVFVHDCQTGDTVRGSVDSSEVEAGGDSIYPSLSADGRYVVFESQAPDLVGGDTNGKWDVFLRDLSSGTTERVSVADDGRQADDDSDSASVSADGRYVAFASLATGLVAGDRNGMRDVFVRDRATGATLRASLSSAGVEGYDDSDSPALAATGACLAFESWAAKLVASDTNGCADVFVAEVGEVPTVGGVSPAAGPVSGGTEVVITGTMFTDVSAVTFGGTAAEFTVDSTTTITAISPAHAAGTVQVQVVAGGVGTRNTSADDFTYHPPTLYQQSDPKLTYVGSWYTAITPWASGGSHTYTASPGAMVTAGFTGTSVKLTGKKGPEYGKAKVTLDGGEAEYIDFYSPYSVCNQFIYQKEGLEDTAHTLVIEWSGQKNQASSGYYISLDVVLIQGALSQAPTPTRYQQDDSSLRYAGPWGTSWSWTGWPSAGSFAYANSSGAVASIKFEGTYLVWIAKTGPQYGKARVSLDGGEAFYLDLYSSGSLYQQKVYTTGLLPDGPHTLTIEWCGLKNTGSSSYYVNIDALDVMGTLVTAPAPPAPPTLYQQSDPKLTYVGSWYTAITPWASGGSYTYTASPGAMVTASFTGTSVKLTGKKGPEYGKAKVTLDGGEAEYIDFYSPYSVCNQFIYQKEGLEDTAHTLVIEWSGQKNQASSGYYISLDVVLIQGALSQAPTPTRYQQDDSSLRYAGPWGTSWSWTGWPSAGSFAYANSSGAVASIKFEGTYLVWIAKTGPQYGKARVSLDGGEAFYLDLYSSGSLYQQKVYTTGLLPDGPHTLSIEWCGLKSTGSSSYYINIDALDVMGTLVTAPAPPAPPTLYQQSDPKLTYVGSWYTAFQWGASGGSFKYATEEGSLACVSFTGTGLELVGKRSPQYGKAKVSLDGGEAEYIDFYSPYWTYQEVVYATGSIEDGEHTLTIEWTGEKNEASTGYLVNVDALFVRGALMQPPDLTWYQQSAGELLYAGVWTEVATASAHDGSFYYADSPGASVVIEFEGTHLEWFAKTSSAYGKAFVRVDDGPAELVDLYSSDTLYRQCVYSTGALTAGTHSLTISWSGIKNAAALGCAVGVDSLCTFGALRVAQPSSDGR